MATQVQWRPAPEQLRAATKLPIVAGLWDAFKRRPATPAARAEITTWERAEGRNGAKQKRRCYQRRIQVESTGTTKF
jgi:hypothetical protein